MNAPSRTRTFATVFLSSLGFAALTLALAMNSDLTRHPGGKAGYLARAQGASPGCETVAFRPIRSGCQESTGTRTEAANVQQ